MSENYFNILEVGKNVRKFLSRRSEKVTENYLAKVKNVRKRIKKCKNVRISYFLKLKFLQENDNLVICQTGHTDFYELFRIRKFRSFLRHFGKITSWEFPDIFLSRNKKNLDKKNFLTFLRIVF